MQIRKKMKYIIISTHEYKDSRYTVWTELCFSNAGASDEKSEGVGGKFEGVRKEKNNFPSMWRISNDIIFTALPPAKPALCSLTPSPSSPIEFSSHKIKFNVRIKINVVYPNIEYWIKSNKNCIIESWMHHACIETRGGKSVLESNSYSYCTSLLEAVCIVR